VHGESVPGIGSHPPQPAHRIGDDFCHADGRQVVDHLQAVCGQRNGLEQLAFHRRHGGDVLLNDSTESSDGTDLDLGHEPIRPD